MTTPRQFEQAPFEPLGEHMTKVKECVALVEPMFHCVLEGDHDRLETLAEQVFKAEHRADIIKNEIRETIPRAFSLPVFRGDLLGYLKLQDDMADAVEDIAVVMRIKNLPVPRGLRDLILQYVGKVLEVCEFLFQCTDRLVDLKESDFKGKRHREILELVAQAEHAEWEADKAEFQLARELFALEDEMKATDIFLWSKLFRELGRLANHADKSAERLRRMMVAH